MVIPDVSVFIATGHTQLKRQWYCPSVSNLSQEEWLAQRKAETAATTVATTEAAEC